MISFAFLDITVIILFFAALLFIGFYAGREKSNDAAQFLLSGRKVGLFVFVLTNVSTWYGGILGVGEFTYNYGLLSWFTQGFPYYLFALFFAFFFAEKIRGTSLFTIPDKLTQTYDKKVGLVSAVIVFILVSPAPYLLMIGTLISLVTGMSLLPSLLIGLLLSVLYLYRGGYKADLYTDVFQFFIMFAGFIILFIAAFYSYDGFSTFSSALPETHLKLTGGASTTFVIVWFLIALWTFTDPGFHQRCYAAKDGVTAKKGIIISVLLWMCFDFLTTSVGLFSRISEPALEQPILAFPLLAENVLLPGFKGIFYAALFATIISTLNSFLFLSATTIGRDFIFRINADITENKLKQYTIYGLTITSVIAIIIATAIPSVIEIWYTLGSICIPGIILLIFGAYFEKLTIPSNIAFIEIISAVSISAVWFFAREKFITSGWLTEIEPMLVGLTAGIIIHIYGVILHRKNLSIYKVIE